MSTFTSISTAHIPLSVCLIVSLSPYPMYHPSTIPIYRSSISLLPVHKSYLSSIFLLIEQPCHPFIRVCMYPSPSILCTYPSIDHLFIIRCPVIRRFIHPSPHLSLPPSIISVRMYPLSILYGFTYPSIDHLFIYYLSSVSHPSFCLSVCLSTYQSNINLHPISFVSPEKPACYGLKVALSGTDPPARRWMSLCWPGAARGSAYP